MKKAKKVKDSPKESSIMKSVLEELNVKASPIQEKKKFDLRDIFWNYPEFVISTYRKFIPLSYILLFGLLVFLFTLILNSNNFANSLRRSNSDDTFVEGVVGGVNTLNPLFVTNNYIERSLESLIFEKFVNIDSNGQPYSGIAKDWEVKENGLVYIFTIDKGHFWHDGTEVTIDDVIFTFNSAIELSKEAGFDSVGLAFAEMEVNKIDENTLQLKINEANPVFFRAISIYILPQKHLKDVEINKIAFAPFSKAPIGSGKYSFVKMDSSSVSLVDNVYDRYNPKIKNFVFKLYPDDKSLEMAFRVGRLDSIGSWDRTISNYVKEYSNFVNYEIVIPDREKLIFINIRKESLKDRNIRNSLNLLLDKEKLLNEYNVGGKVLKGPYPSSSWAFNKDIDFHDYNPSKAGEILKSLGYSINPNSGYFENAQGEVLTFTMSYLSNPSNNRLVKLIVDYYKKEGIFIKLEELDYERITQELIATRNFELLLYEIETSVDPDQYNLWHSLKINYPDLNLSGYEYDRVDILLEEGRQSLDRAVRKQKYLQFQKYLVADSPAIFLYNPLFEYYVRENLEGIDFSNISHSYERFHNIEDWYWK